MESSSVTQGILPTEACKMYHHKGNQLFPFVCGLCNLAFRNLHCFYTHFQEHHELLGGIFYHLCQFSHDSRQDSDREPGNFGLNILSCIKCSQTFSTVCAAHKHLVECHKTKMYLVDVDEGTVFPKDEENCVTENISNEQTKNNNRIAGKQLSSVIQQVDSDTSCHSSGSRNSDKQVDNDRNKYCEVSERQFRNIKSGIPDRQKGSASQQVNCGSNENGKRISSGTDVNGKRISSGTDVNGKRISSGTDENGKRISSGTDVNDHCYVQAGMVRVSSTSVGTGDHDKTCSENVILTDLSSQCDLGAEEVVASQKIRNHRDAETQTAEISTSDDRTAMEIQERAERNKNPESYTVGTKGDVVSQLNAGDCGDVDGWTFQFFDTEFDTEHDTGSQQRSSKSEFREPELQGAKQDSVDKESVIEEVTIDTILRDIYEGQSSEDEFDIDVDSTDDPSYKPEAEETQESDSNGSVIDQHEVNNTVSEPLKEKTLTKKPWRKRQKKPCLYCKKHYFKISRHLAEAHANEKDVISILQLPKKSLLRKRAWMLLVNKAVCLLNEEVTKTGVGNIIVKRYSKNQDVKNIAVCICCKSYFMKKHLRKHQKACFKCPELLKLRPNLAGKILVPYRIALEGLEENVISLIEDEEIKDLVESDSVIKLYGNTKYREEDSHDKKHELLSNRLMELGLLLKTIKCEDPDILSLMELMKASNWNLFIESVKKLAKFNEGSDKFADPSLARRLGQGLRKCAELEYEDSFKWDDIEVRQLTETFLKKYRLLGPLTLEAAKVQRPKKNKNTKLTFVSLTEDVVKLSKILESKYDRLVLEIEQSPSESYPELAKICLAQIMLLNMERNTVVPRLTVTEYRDGKIGCVSEKVGKKLSVFEKKLSETHLIVEVKGSFNHRIPILLTKKLQESVEMLLKHREVAGLKEQELLFAKCDDSQRPYSGTDVMLEFVGTVELQHPSIFTSAKYRKHIATVFQVISLEDRTDAIADVLESHNISAGKLRSDKSWQAVRMDEQLQGIDRGLGSDADKTVEDEETVENEEEEEEDKRCSNMSQDRTCDKTGQTCDKSGQTSDKTGQQNLVEDSTENEMSLDLRPSTRRKRKHTEEIGSPSMSSHEVTVHQGSSSSSSAEVGTTKRQKTDGSSMEEEDSLKILLNKDVDARSITVEEFERNGEESFRFQLSKVKPSGKRKCKRHACFFCKKLVTKISRHVADRHKREKEVMNILSMAKNSPERKNAWQLLVNKGDFYNNNDVINKSYGTLITIRSLKSNNQKGINSFLPCQFCRGLFLKKGLWRHIRTCRVKNSKSHGVKCKPSLAGKLLMPQKDASKKDASKKLHDNVLEHMTDDEVKSAILNDSVIMHYGSIKCVEKTDIHKKCNFVNELRYLGRIILTARSEDSSVGCLSDLFDVEKWNLLVKCIKILSDYDIDTRQLRKPVLARRLGSCLKKCAEVEYFRYFNTEDSEKSKLIEAFLEKHKLEWENLVTSTSNSHSEESEQLPRQPLTEGNAFSQSCFEEGITQQSAGDGNSVEPSVEENSNKKQSVLSLVRDVVLLNKTLESQAEHLYCEINKDPSKVYPELVRVCLAWIFLVNIRKSQEVQGMTIKQYHGGKAGDDEDLLQNKLSLFERKIHSSFFIIEIKHKNEPSEAVLLPKAMTKYIDSILKHRESIDICNQDLLFARPGRSRHPYRGMDTLQSFVDNSNLQHSDEILSAKFRSLIGMISQVISFTSCYEGAADVFKTGQVDKEVKVAAKVAEVLKHLQSINTDSNSSSDLDSIELMDMVEALSVDKDSDTGEDTGEDTDAEDRDEDNESSTEVQDKEICHSKDTHEEVRDLNSGQVVCHTKKDVTENVSPGRSSRGTERKTAKKTEIGGKHVWTDQEKEAIKKEFSKHILRQKVPGKDDVEEAQSRHPCLQNFHWKRIKFAVYNMIITKRKRPVRKDRIH